MDRVEIEKIEYDENQLNTMKESLISFENKWIALDSLIEILIYECGVLKHKDEQWNENFSREFNILRKINTDEINKDNRDELIKNSVHNLKILIRKRLNKLFFDKCDLS